MSLRHPHPLAIVALVLAAGIAPPAPVTPASWAGVHMVVPDGPARGEIWQPDTTPYIVEPLNHFDPNSPVNEFAVMKSAQTGFTTLMLAAIGHAIDRDPCRMMVVQPNDAALTEFNREKLSPVLEQSKPLKVRVRPQTSRSATGSTTYSKVYPGGSLTLTIATSSSDLSSKTVKKVFLDEIDRYPDDVDGQGDPLGLVEGRYLAFRKSGDWKRCDVSTPTIKGLSSIEERFLAGDQRRWHVPCPGCGQPFVFTFDRARFRFEDGFPHKAHYVTACCGTVIEYADKDALVRQGRWIATDPKPGAYPSYHFDVLSSPFVPWDDVAAKYVASRGRPEQEKGFDNLWLGIPHEQQLAEVTAAEIVARLEDFPRGTVPIGVGATVITVDLNGDWFEWALWGFGPSRSGSGVDQWLVDHGKIDGKPDDQAAWTALAALADRDWPWAGGRSHKIDLLGVDTGFGTNDVYRFVRGRPLTRALDGRPNRPGDPRAAMPLGTPVKVVCKDRFARPLFKVWLYPVGSHDLKIWLAHAVKALVDGTPGANDIRLPREVLSDVAFAEQLIAEVLVPVEGRDGHVHQEWRKRRGVRNELLDLAVYARALGLGTAPNGLGLDRWTPADWARRIAERHGVDPRQASLFEAPPPAEAPRPAAAPPASPVSAGDLMAEIARLATRRQ